MSRTPKEAQWHCALPVCLEHVTAGERFDRVSLRDALGFVQLRPS